jgi:uncharacterized protein (TIGR02246 family)
MTLPAQGPEHVVEAMDRAFNEGDLATLLSFYEEAAIVVAEPSRTVSGKAQLRTFFENAMRSEVSAKQIKTRVIEADGLALFLSRWTLTPNEVKADAPVRTFVATTVFRKQPDGSWKALIDNPVGPLVLDAE